MENQNVGTVQGQTEGAAKEKKPSFSNREFAAVCMKAKSVAEIAEITKLSVATINQKRSHLRSLGFPLPTLQRGRTAGTGTVTEVTEQDLEFLATVSGKSVEELRKESQETKEAVALRAQKVKSGKSKDDTAKTNAQGQQSGSAA